jgi:hypothetical protein
MSGVCLYGVLFTALVGAFCALCILIARAIDPSNPLEKSPRVRLRR